ncbi:MULTISPECIES: glycoside hydrolase family 2 TIM barrel-domain containing protein [Bacteroides]|uniref:glycoside hydrolase family 2 protein n=1 Tax=Bacteroides TaxID=816 RepID=UPI000B2F49F0|nr:MULTISPECIES: glycoside hydrolase family 2 TIM barrel-domain containing protein [Bacteroides]
MRAIYIFCLLLHALCFQIACAPTNVQPREVTNINNSWKYSKGDFKGAEQADYNDGSWENIGLPHSFSIPYFMSKDFYVGYGWYRKHLLLDKEDLTKKLFLEFDGVFQEAEVFVNGKLAGRHVGGYTGFPVDISDCAQIGDNVIAVRVNNLWQPDVAPRAGEHVFSGGIYRNVRLVKKAPVHIAWYGTFVTTPQLEEQNGQSSLVKIETELCNDTDEPGTFRLQTRILNEWGKEVTVTESTETLEANERKVWIQQTEPVQKPALWTPQTPVLYKAISSLYKDDVLLDRMETPFGFRWFKWTADKGFFLNGNHFVIRGANVHQDQAGWGDAVTESAAQRDVAMVKEAGFNFIRGSHYPHAPAFAQACDDLGLMFWSEAPFWGIGGFEADGYWNSSAYPVDQAHEAAFEASALQQLEEMIRIHRNHPSIVVWSVCNEAFFTAPEAMDGMRGLLKKMVDRVHQLDPTRLAAIGGAQRPIGEGRIDRIGDVVGYNGDGAVIPDFQNPGVPNVVSEYGSEISADRPGEYDAKWGCMEQNEGWKGYPWRSGQVIWCAFDHGSIAGNMMAKLGIIDYFRIPKRFWYWYRNEYAGIAPPEWPSDGTAAKLQLKASSTMAKTDGTDDVQLWVTVCDALGKSVNHSPNVQLRIVSGPGEFPTGRSIRFEADSDIRIMDGQAAIAIRSYYAGKTVIEATSDGLEPARVTIEFEGETEYQKGITPVVEHRPYKRFVREKQTEIIQTFGRNNPTFASSNEAGHTPGRAADGNTQTYWKASAEDKVPYWILDTEKGLRLKEIQLHFPNEVSRSYVVEASHDNHTWQLLCDKSQNPHAEQNLLLTLPDTAPTGRFIRIRFLESDKAALTEVIVKGIVLE